MIHTQIPTEWGIKASEPWYRLLTAKARSDGEELVYAGEGRFLYNGDLTERESGQLEGLYSASPVFVAFFLEASAAIVIEGLWAVLPMALFAAYAVVCLAQLNEVTFEHEGEIA